MGYFVKNLQSTSDLVSNLYNGIDANGMAQLIDKTMQAQGYKMTEGQIGNGTYEKGNRVMRLLFGAFVKYFKFSITISANPQGELMVNLFKQTSGMSGGLIGVNQVKNELKRMAGVMQTI
jgi:hypothetical protein